MVRVYNLKEASYLLVNIYLLLFCTVTPPQVKLKTKEDDGENWEPTDYRLQSGQYLLDAPVSDVF